MKYGIQMRELGSYDEDTDLRGVQMDGIFSTLRCRARQSNSQHCDVRST